MTSQIENHAEHIDVTDPLEVRRWCQHFVFTEAALRAAVAQVGPSPERVRPLVALGSAVHKAGD